MTRIRNLSDTKYAASRKRNSDAAVLAAIEALEGRTLLTSVVVNNVSDTAVGAGVVTLRDAIGIANSSATPTAITFSGSVFGTKKTITLAGTQLELKAKQPVTIIGPAAGVTVSGNGKSRVFGVDAGVTATFARLTIADGHAPAFFDSGAGYDLFEGGGIDNAGTLTLSHCTISGNTATGAGAGYGGGIYSTGPLTLQNSTVSSNSAVGGPSADGSTGYPSLGGGIHSAGSSLTITGSTLSDNTCTGGGAPHNIMPELSHNNFAQGGAIYSAHGALSLTASTVSGNSATGGFTAYPDTIGGDADGGGICTFSSATITSSIISGNTATGGAGVGYGTYGGGASGGGIFGGVALVITGSTISGNHATAATGFVGSAKAFGGGISASNLTLILSTVSGNTALGAAGGDNGGGTGFAGGDATGGGVSADGTLSVLQSTIAFNAAIGGKGNDAQLAPDSTAGAGGNGRGGGLDFYSGAFDPGIATLTDSTVAYNAVRGGRGGNASLDNPGAKGGSSAGGGIDFNGTLKLLDTTLSGNTAIGGAGGAAVIMPPDINEPAGAAGAASGGALSVAGGTALADNSILYANNAGGAADIAGPLQQASANNLIGTGGGLTNGVNGNQVGVIDAKLSALGNHGGPTQTVVPLAGNPAIDAGSIALIPAGIFADQRGLPRISGGKVDIGAVEVQAPGGASISGGFFNDLNHDGVRQDNEPGVAGWQVYIDQNKNGLFDAGEITTFTTSNGSYKFTGLAPGAYRIREVRPDGWARTEPAGLDPLGYYNVNVAANQAVAGKDFGNYFT